MTYRAEEAVEALHLRVQAGLSIAAVGLTIVPHHQNGLVAFPRCQNR